MSRSDFFTEAEKQKLDTKKSFLVQKSLRVDIMEMGVEEKALFLEAMFAYGDEYIEPNFEGNKYRFLRAAFTRFKKDFFKDNRGWLKACSSKSIAKKKEWEKRKSGNSEKDADGNPIRHPTYG